MALRNRVFIGCTGQGDKSVFPHAGRPYWENSPAFREKIYQAQEWFPGLRIIELALFEDDPKKLVPTEVAQPLAYTFALATAAALMEQKEKAFLRKSTVYGGQSVGTGAACALANGYSQAFGARMVGERSAFMHQACQKTKGKMVVLLIPPDNIHLIEALCPHYGVEIGNRNSPSQIVLTGARKWVDRAVDEIRNQKLTRRIVPLLTEGAYHHSELMAPAVEPFKKWLNENLEDFSPRSPIVGNQGQIVASREDAIYELADGIAAPSCFNATMETTYTQLHAKRTIECGPANVIEGMVTDYRRTLEQSASKKWKRIALGITVATATALFVATFLNRDSE